MTIYAAFEIGIPAVIEEIHKIIGDRPVYISQDIDCVDPTFTPETGTPEVGSFINYQMMQMVRGLQGVNLAGFDLVEFCHPIDCGEITSILSANLVFEFLSLIAIINHE